MEKIIIKKKPEGWYFACTEDTDAVLATGETKEDCIANFNKLDLGDKLIVKTL
jgi:predicted RNase H-like HicB family nuclease